MKFFNVADFITIGLMAVVFILLANFVLRKTGLERFALGNAGAVSA